MKKIIIGIITFTIFIMVMFYYNSNEKLSVNKKKLDKKDIKEFVQNKPYTLLYFWVSWCGYSQDGLVNDYYTNYGLLNNDTVQTMLIVLSDTVSVNTLMYNNNIKLPYKYLKGDSYPPVIGNLKDGYNRDEFIYDVFNYKYDDGFFFPTVLLVDNNMNGLTWSTKTYQLIDYIRAIEKKKVSIK